MHFLKKGQKIRAWVHPPPSFGQCPKENVFFSLMSSLSHTATTSGILLFQENTTFWPFLAHFGSFVANSRTCWCTSTGRNDAVVYQNWQISRMFVSSKAFNFSTKRIAFKSRFTTYRRQRKELRQSFARVNHSWACAFLPAVGLQCRVICSWLTIE